MPKPNKGEHKGDYLIRCMADKEMNDKFPDNMQRYAVCQSIYINEKMAIEKISFDFDGVLTTAKGKELAKSMAGSQLYIISARDNKQGMLEVADELNIPHFRVFALGNNDVKVFKIKDLGINKHYDNNPDVIAKLEGIGVKFEKFESYTDYPQAATENAKIALRWVEKNGWGDCGTQVGKIRASMLSNREPLSEETIAAMASFERHRQNSNKPLGDGCGRLMWLAWGGDEGIEWAQRKLKEIRNE